MSEKNIVEEFVSVREELFKYFECEEEFFVKPLLSNKWKIEKDEDFYFLQYWTEKDKQMTAVIVRKGDKPMVFENDKYTMVIGIDCVKIGFIFSNKNGK